MARDEAPLGDDRRGVLLERYRRRHQDLEETEWERLLERLRNGEVICAIGREMVERGCAHSTPSSVNVCLCQVKRLLHGQGSGAPGRGEGDGRSEDEQPIDGQEALKRVRWMIRAQEGRVRKALALESRMGGFPLPQTDKAIKLLCLLTDKEWKLLKALGGLQAAAPRSGRMEEGARVDLGVDQAGALWVVTTVQSVLQLARESESSTENLPPTDGTSAPASHGEGSSG